MPSQSFVLTLSCSNRPGIVAAVASFLLDTFHNIVDAQQFDDELTGQFFMRVVFNGTEAEQPLSTGELNDQFAGIASKFGMTWQMRRQDQRRRVMILVSKSDHCLNDLLYRWRIGELPMDIAAVVSNHPRESYSSSDIDSLPFHYLPTSPDTKSEQELQLWELIQSTETDLVVLARYMQILSADLASKLAGRCINIHHSFLPGFKGARPYHQAHERGVKLIGATSHFVTTDLDEGPIIEQDIERITHRETPDDLIRKGRDIERRVLARAVRNYLEDRILLNGKKTVVFTG